MTETTKTIGRKRKKNGFTQISNTLIEDSRLSWKAKGILLYLLSRPDNWKVNKTDIQRKATDGREALTNGLNELKEFGYLHIFRNHLDNGQFEWVWEYDDTPFDNHERENHKTGNPQEIVENVQIDHVRENRQRVNRQRETRLYNNTDFNNTDLNNTNKDKEIKTIKSNSPLIEREFEKLWKDYPRKIGKKKAFDSYKKARKIKKIPYETIENGLYRYIDYLKSQGTEEQYIQHGSTFFNQEKWQDEFETTHFDKKPKLSSFTQMCLNEMDDPDEFLNMIGVNSSYDQGRNRKIIDVSESQLH